MLVWEIEVNVQKFANDITSQYKMGVVNFTVLQSITFIFLLILNKFANKYESEHFAAINKNTFINSKYIGAVNVI